MIWNKKLSNKKAIDEHGNFLIQFINQRTI